MYTDLLIRIKNAQTAKKEVVKVPFSAMDMAVLEILVKHGYLAEALRKGRPPKRFIEVTLNHRDGKGTVGGIRFLSTPSRHLYRGAREIRPSHGGHRIMVLSTSKGLMEAHEAKQANLGGELLFEVW